MIPIKYVRQLTRRCYLVGHDGQVTLEPLDVSLRIFAKPHLAHIVIPFEFKGILDTWTTFTPLAKAEDDPKFFVLRLVRWGGKLWFILSINYDALYSVAILAAERDFELTTREFRQDFGKVQRELFPYSGPTFRSLMRPLLTLEKRKGRPR